MVAMRRDVKPSGEVRLRVIRGGGTPLPKKPARIRVLDVLRDGFPGFGLPREVFRYRLRNCWRLLGPLLKLAIGNRLKLSFVVAQLRLTVVRANGEVVPLGLASMRVVTTAGVNFIVDAFQNLVEVENLKFHGIGTGGTAEAVGDTTLVTELTTQYNPDNTRATGSTTEGASANIYRTVGTNTVDAAAAITEHGIFSQAATGGGTLLDRSLFSVINLANGDSLQSTYDLTVNSGG